MEYKEYKIRDFNISFDGIYWLSFKKGGKIYRESIRLNYNQLDVLIKNEGICVEKMDDTDWWEEGVTFKKTAIILYGNVDEGFLTDEFALEYQDRNIFFLEFSIE